MSKPIVVATDLSARSDRAIDRAAMIARSRNAPLHVVYAIKAKSDAAQHPDIARDAVLDVLPVDARDATIHLPVGSAHVEIARVAADTDAGLIVTGVARFNDIYDYFIGNAVDHIVRHAGRPVLIVKRRPRQPYRRIVAATDFSDFSANALKAADDLFPDLPVKLVHGWHVPFGGWQKANHVVEETEAAARSDMESFIEDSGFGTELVKQVDGVLVQGGAEVAIQKTVNTDPDALLVLSTHGCGGLRQATIGSTASSLITAMPCDSLIIPPTCA